MSVHVVMLAFSCGALAVSAAGGPLRGITDDVRRARQMGVLVSTAMVAGNAACLLPGTPVWYSAALIALTVGGLVWMVVSLISTGRAGRTRQTRTHALPFVRQDPPNLVVVRGSTYSARPGPSAMAASAPTSFSSEVDAIAGRPPQLQLLPGGQGHGGAAASAVRSPGRGGAAAASYAVIDATEVTVRAPHSHDESWNGQLGDGESGGGSPREGRAFVTRRDLDVIGPRWSRAQNVSVARGIRTLAPASGRRRAEGSDFGPRTHSADGALLRARLKALYAEPPTVADRPRGTRA